MTEQQIDRERLRKLADAATPGPWEADYSEEDNYSIKSPGTGWGDGYAWVSDPSNAEFIAAARAAIPQLLDQIDQQERELDSWMTRAYEAEGKLWKAEARIKAVRDVLDEPDAMIGTRLHVTVDRIRRALESVSPLRPE